MNGHTRYIAIIVIILTLVLGGVFVFRQRLVLIPNQPPVEHTTNSVEWLTYHDQTWHYRIDYPSDRFVFSEYGNVGFSESKEDGPGTGSSVNIRSTQYRTPEEVAVASMAETKDSGQTIVIEHPLTIDGYHGIVTHYVLEGVDHPFPKMVTFIKDGYLFEITDMTEDYERTFSSFQFEE